MRRIKRKKLLTGKRSKVRVRVRVRLKCKGCLECEGKFGLRKSKKDYLDMRCEGLKVRIRFRVLYDKREGSQYA